MSPPSQAFDPSKLTEDELRAHLRLWPVYWLKCLGCEMPYEFQVNGIGGRCSYFCSDECRAKHRPGVRW